MKINQSYEWKHRSILFLLHHVILFHFFYNQSKDWKPNIRSDSSSPPSPFCLFWLFVLTDWTVRLVLQQYSSSHTFSRLSHRHSFFILWLHLKFEFCHSTLKRQWMGRTWAFQIIEHSLLIFDKKKTAILYNTLSAYPFYTFISDPMKNGSAHLTNHSI